MADNSSELARILAEQSPADEWERQRAAIRERTKDMTLRDLPGELGLIGQNGWAQMTDPRLLPKGHPLAWINALSGLMRGVGRSAFGTATPDDDLQLPSRNKLGGGE